MVNRQHSPKRSKNGKKSPVPRARTARDRPRLAAALALALLLLPLPASSEEKTPDGKPGYTFGVFPFFNVSTTESIFAPLAAELSRAIGKEVRFQTAPDFEKFMERLRRQEYDIAHIQPFDYVRIARDAGYLLAAGRREELYGLFAVLKDSPVKTIKDLKGKTVGLPPRVAAIAYLARLALQQAGIDPARDVTIRNFSTHHSCLQQLLIGNIHACGASQSSLRLFEEQMKTTFRIIAKTPASPHTVFVVHSRVPRNDRDSIRKTLLSTSLSGIDPAMKKLFTPAEGRPFRPIDDSEFDVVISCLKLLGEDVR